MSSPLDTNRLGDEPSPYLVQHADNPVNWQPWDETALEAAAERDRPIFCSIGYAACHWCHVMEEESFENDEIAERLNAEFIPIKVDREERPDIDRIYQTICQLTSGNGGWPLSVFLTPDGRPFYVGTYFPPRASRGRPGFLDVLDSIASSWEDDREVVEERADQWSDAIRNQVESIPGEGQTVTTTFSEVANSALRSVDDEHGGFGTQGPKFPQPQRMHLLFRADSKLDNPAYVNAMSLTLDAIANRGLYDHIGGGFHRYATDRAWEVPHFEKMLYDNAELTRVFLEAYRRTGRDRYETVATETLSFVRDELQHPDGGFYSTLDAQSEGREGAFYVWTPTQVRQALSDPSHTALVCEHFGITEAGNFENGTTVLRRARTVRELAADHDLSEATIEETLEQARTDLLQARSERPRPARDEKILAGWNGLMISAYARAGLILDTPWIEDGAAAMTFVRSHLWNESDERLQRRYKDGTVGIQGYLDDYAYLGRASLDLFQSTGTFEWLAFAVDLADVIVEEFWTPADGTLYYTPDSGEGLVSRPQDPTDLSIPSSLAVAADLLSNLDVFVPDRDFGAIAEEVVGAYRPAIKGSPLQHVGLAMLEDRFNDGHLEWTIVADDFPSAWREAIVAAPHPDELVAHRPPDQATLTEWLERLDVSEIPPIWADRTRRDDATTAYVCHDFTCSPPLTNPDEATEWVDRLT